VVVGLVVFHTAVIFGAGEFPVKAGSENTPATVFVALVPRGACRCSL